MVPVHLTFIHKFSDIYSFGDLYKIKISNYIMESSNNIMICCFCLRQLSSSESEHFSKNNDNQLVLKRFEKILDHYLGTGFLSNLNAGGEQKCLIETCQDCTFLVKGFCDLYHNWKRLELELNWKLRRLKNVMKSANKVQSRRQAFEANLSSCDVDKIKHFELISSFRKEFQQKCHRHLSSTFPKVILKRLKDSPTISGNSDASTVNPDGRDSNHLFLGWISTYAAVLILALFGRWFKTHQQTHLEDGVPERFSPLEDSLSETTPCDHFEMEGSSANNTSEYQDFLGSWFQEPSEAIELVDQPKSLVPDCDSNEDLFNEVLEYFEEATPPPCDVPSSLEIEPVSQIEQQSEMESKQQMESSEFEAPETSQPRPILVLQTQLKLRKRKEFQERVSPVQLKRRNIRSTNSTVSFSCFCCSRKFNSFSRLQRHRRAFTHILMKRKWLGKRKEERRKCSRRTKRQSKTSNKMANENVGVLRPLRKISKPSVAKDDADGSSEDDEQDSLNIAHDEWNMSCSDDDTSNSSSSSGGISSDEEMEIELPVTATPNPRVPVESYACTIDSCGKSFHFKEELEEHQQLHGSFPCSLCDAVEKYAPDLAFHESDHMKQTKTENRAENEKKRKKSLKVPRYCARCNYKTVDRFRFMNHYLKSHLKLPPQRFMCRICTVWMANPKCLGIHVRTKHNDKVGKHMCDLCPAYFTKEAQLFKHKKSHQKESKLIHHKKRQPKVEKENDDDTTSSSSSSGSISSDEEMEIELPVTATPKLSVPTESYACIKEFCVKSFHFKEELDEHLQHHGSFPCSLCDVVEEYAPDLALHESDHMEQLKTETQPEKSGEVRKKSLRVMRFCARCNYKTDARFLYINHFLKTHLKVPTQRIMCRICKVWTTGRKGFLQHMKNVHKGNADKHVCVLCPAYFTNESQLIKHIKSHQQESKLIQHKKSQPEVTKEKTHFCDVNSCNEGFLSQPELDAHKRLHGNFTCKICSSVENHGASLAIHELSHNQPDSEATDDDIYSCPRCSVHTNSKESYVSHFTWAHLKLRSGSFPCSICQAPLLDNEKSKSFHFLSHHGTRGGDQKTVKKCKHCTAYFLRRKQLQFHKKEIHPSSTTSSESSDDEKGQDNQCTDCGKFFSSASSLRRHKKGCKKKGTKIKAVKKEFGCKVGACKHRFDFKEELEIHEKYHGKFSCQFCKVVKNFAPNLAIHEIVHGKGRKGKSIYCARCGYLGHRKNDLINHCLKQHFGLTPPRVMCPICKILYPKANLRQHHLKFHNIEGVDPQSVHKCDECDAYFLNSLQLKEHVKNAHGSSSTAPKLINPEQHQRKYCNAGKRCQKWFESEEDLENHRKLHGKFSCSFCPVVESYAPNLAVHETTHVESTASTAVKKKGKPFNCSRCASILYGKYHLVTHFLELHLNLPSENQTCQNCGEKLPPKTLYSHFKLHHNTDGMREEDIARCDQCPAFFKRPHQLAVHKKKMHGEDDICVDCGKKFKSSSNLRNHRFVVHKLKEADFPHACDVEGCDRRFERVSDLGWHVLMLHDGKGKDKSHVCHECGKKLAHKTAFVSHMRLHGAAKPSIAGKRYICETCGKFFKAQDQLNVHKLSHTGPASWEYVCLFCDKRCPTELKLMEHIRAHTNEKPFICEFCGAEYAHGHNLRDHKNKKHDANDIPRKRKILNGHVSKKGQKLPRLKK